MKQRLLLVFIFLGSLYISFSVGHELGYRQSNDATIDSAEKVYSLTIAYSAALSLKTEISHHTFIKSGNKVVAEQFSLDRINTIINQIETIDYKKTPFEAEINQNLTEAKEYVKNARSQEKSFCSGLMEPDTLMRDNKRQPLRCHYDSKTQLQTIPKRVQRRGGSIGA